MPALRKKTSTTRTGDLTGIDPRTFMLDEAKVPALNIPTPENEPEPSSSDELWLSVEPADREKAKVLCAQIRDHLERDAMFVLEKGLELAGVKAKEDHGGFLNLVWREARLRPKTSQRWMKAGKTFQGNFTTAAKLGRQAIYELSADSAWVPAVRDKVMKDAAGGNYPGGTHLG